MTVRNKWNTERLSTPVSKPGEKSRVDQTQRDKVNVNSIMKKAQANGYLPQPNRPAYYGDVTGMPENLLEAFTKVEQASLAFNALPAEVRRGMGNDPRRLEEWLSDEKNHEMAAKHGLINKPEPDPALESPGGAPKEPKASPGTDPAGGTDSVAKGA
jgi:phage internal scaffolding protein